MTGIGICLLIVSHIFTFADIFLKAPLFPLLIGGYSDGLPVIGDSFDIVLFRHNIAESSRKLSLQYFGEFDRLKVETGISIGRKSTSVFSYHQNKSVSIQETRDMRLKPEKIMSLDKGRAVFRLVSGEEGVVQMF